MAEGVIFPEGCAVGPRFVGSMTGCFGLGMANAELMRRTNAACVEVSKVSCENQSREDVPPGLETRKACQIAGKWYKASDLRFLGIGTHLLTFAVV